MPAPGQVTYYRPPGGFGVRVDSGVYPGYHISPYYDSMVGKLVVWGSSREEAITRMQRSLKEFIIEGVPTTIPFHLLVLENEHFRKGDVYTNFIRKHVEEAEDEEKQENAVSLANIKSRLAKNKHTPTIAPVVTPETIAVLGAAVTIYGSSQGQNLAITDIQTAGQPASQASAQPRKDDFSPWRLLGVNELLMGRGIKR